MYKPSLWYICDFYFAVQETVTYQFINIILHLNIFLNNLYMCILFPSNSNENLELFFSNSRHIYFYLRDLNKLGVVTQTPTWWYISPRIPCVWFNNGMFIIVIDVDPENEYFNIHHIVFHLGLLLVINYFEYCTLTST